MYRNPVDITDETEITENQEEVKLLRHEIEELNQKYDQLEMDRGGITEVRPTMVLTSQYDVNNTQITSAEISKYISGVVDIYCGASGGSGSILKLNNGEYVVLTNYHVVEEPLYDKDLEMNYCVVTIEDNYGDSLGFLYANLDLDYLANVDLDIAMSPLIEITSDSPLFDYGAQLNKLNTSITGLTHCPHQIDVGSPVISIGYPSSGTVYGEFIEGIEGSKSNRITTNGIVSGYDDSSKYLANARYVDYFVTSKIDSGNSGGISLSKHDGQICFLGVPTLVNIGDYEVQGLVQNVNNFLND